MDVFIRQDGQALRVVPGFRKAARTYRAAVTPLAAWSDADYTAAAEKKRRRFERLLDAVRRWRGGSIEGAEMLDVGCGDGTNCLLAALQPVRQVVGIDLHLPLLDPAAGPVRRLAETVLRQVGLDGGVDRLLAERPVRLDRADARSIPFPSGAFDLLISRSAMEHLMPIEAALAEMARVVRPGGLIHHSIDPFYWLRGCHKRGLTDIPFAHARLSLDDFHRFVAEHESPHKAHKRLTRLQTLNRLTAREWRSLIDAGPFEVLEWDEQPSEHAQAVLAEHPDVAETLLPGVAASDLVCGRIDVWLRRRHECNSARYRTTVNVAGATQSDRTERMLSPADRSVVLQEPALPGLAVLLDSEDFLGRLRAARPELDLRGAVATYLRYKPATSCIAGFRLDLAGHSVDVYARALRTGDEAKVGKLTRASKVPGPLGAGHVLLPDCGVILLVFPNDGALPSLRVLGDPERRDPLLLKLLGDRFGAACGLSTLAYKPERRFVGRVTNAGGSSAVLRFYTPMGYAEATRNAKLFARTPSVRVPARLGRSSRWHAVALDWVSGRSLYEQLVMAEADPRLSGILSQVGEAVAAIADNGSDKLRPRTKEAEIAGIMAAARGVAALLPRLAIRAADLAERAASALAALPAVRRPIHGDLYAQQVIIGDDGRIGLIDIDSAALGDPAADLANFGAHLERHAGSGHVSRDRIGPAVDVMVNAYEARAAESVRSRLRAYAAASLLRLAPHPFRSREPDWPDQIAALLDRAAEALDIPTNPCVSSVPARTAVPPPSRHQGVTVEDRFGVLADPKLAFLKDALDPGVCETAVANAVAESGLPLENRRLRAVRVSRCKPGRRCLVEYEFDSVCGGGGAPITIIGKARAKGVDEAAYKVHQNLWETCFATGSPDGLCVPRPLGLIPRFHMSLQHKVPGVSLAQLIIGPNGQAYARRAAELIHKLHAARVSGCRRHGIDDELRILYERLPRVADADPRLRSGIDRLLSECQRVAAFLAVAHTTGIHRDFYPDQVVVDGSATERLYLLDLDLFAEGDPALDVGNFNAHLTEFAIRSSGNPTEFAELERAMTDRYVALAEHKADLRYRIEAYAALTLARHVFISTLFADRRRFTERLLLTSAQRLAELG